MQNSSLLDLYIVQTINQGNPFTFHAQNNNKQHNMNDDKWIHHTKQPPRLSLREYGGPLTPINEIPQSSSSLIYTKHRLSSSLTLPTTYTITQHENENDENDVSRRRHSLPSSVNNETYDTTNLLLVDFPHNEISRQQQRRSLLLVDFPHNNKTCDYDDDDDDDLTIATNKNGCNNKDEKNDETTHHVVNTTTTCCDEYGRCIKHPNVQLRSKLFFWDRILLTACPDCCMEELTRLYENYSTTGNKNEDEDDDNDSNSSITTIQESSDYYD